MMDWAHCPAVERVPGRVSGAWLFKDTRVPVRALFENLEGGATIEQFLEWFPGVTREQVSWPCLNSPSLHWLKLWPDGSAMRILFDQGTPVPLRRSLTSHQISTAFEIGWAELENGDLLGRAEGQFVVFVTTDQNLRYRRALPAGNWRFWCCQPRTGWSFVNICRQ